MEKARKEADRSEDEETDAPAVERPEKQPRRSLFNDLAQFKDRDVLIAMFGGETVKGKLVGYDEVANCVLEDEGKRIVVFGKSISMVCEE